MRDAARRHVNASTVIALAALVLATSGGAWAATRYLVTSTKQIKPSVLKQLKGAAGPKGAAGANGQPGPQGAQGPPGAPGTPGKDGKEGKEGPEGQEGNPGQTGFTEVLPAGKTETGTWAVNLVAPASEQLTLAPISFSIPAAAAGEAVYLNETQTAGKAGTGGCTGTAAAPTAPAGKLCIYTESEETEKLAAAPKTAFNEELGRFGKPGSFLEFVVQAEGEALAHGSWAVTG